MCLLTFIRANHRFIVSLWLLLTACNPHPVESLNANLNAVDRIENRLPAKTKLDFLFVIDDSGSMCQEQERLAKDFRLFSTFLFDELQGAADYRIAVISTDIGVSGSDTQRGHPAASFLYQPAFEPQSCYGLASDYIPDTSDCEQLGEALPIISSAQLESLSDDVLPAGERREDRLKAELERQFRCRATLGTGGGGTEKGLEAMRLALSCQGPNAAQFSACCVNYGTSEAFYNPACAPSPEEEPSFLRPDATLVVLIISDEDDCSTPADSPNETSRLICRTGGMVDEDLDGIPDIYANFCPDPQGCYRRECNDYIAQGSSACYEAVCEITEDVCTWRRGALSSVREYKDFLQNLKARPFDQLLVAPLVGFRTYTEVGNPHTYIEAGAPSAECENPQSAVYGTEVCCPGGVCGGFTTPIESCNIADQNVLAYGGGRYLELADMLGVNALGCPIGQEPTLDPVSGTFTMSPECISICSEDLSAPLEVVKERVATLVNTYCLERSPPCVVRDEGQTRRCEGDEALDPSHYSLSVSLSCDDASCGDAFGSRTLSDEEWALELRNTGCPAELVLNQLPPAGSEVIIEFISEADALISTP